MTYEEIKAKVDLAYNERNYSNYEISNHFAYEVINDISLNENTEIDTIEQYIDCYILLGWNLRILGEIDKAIHFNNEGLLISEKFSLSKKSANLYINQGVVHLEIDDYTKALNCFNQALILNEESSNSYGIAVVNANIGNLHLYLEDFEKALEYYLISLSYFEEFGNKFDIALGYQNIGIANFHLSNFTTSLEFFSKALLIYEEIGNKSGIAACFLNSACIYNELKEFESAFKYFKKSLSIFEEIGDKHGIASVHLDIGILFSTKDSTFNNTEISKQYLNNAIQKAQEIESKSILVKIYQKYYNLYYQESNFEEALNYHVLFSTLEKEIQSTEAKKQADRFDIARKTAEREKQLAVERARYEGRESILRNILPDSVTDRLVKGENPIADHIDSASVLFMDLVGFTSLSSIAPPKQLVYLLDAIFHKADEVVEQFGLEKIKTIGDGYLAVANVTTPLEEHQKATALAALKLLETMKDFTVNIPNNLGDTEWLNDMKDLEIRIGIHTGEVVAGIIGKNKYTYDLWGDAVNVASRMESNSEAGRIHISEEFAKSIEKYPEFSIIPRGEISIKGKGTMNTFWLEKAK